MLQLRRVCVVGFVVVPVPVPQSIPSTLPYPYPTLTLPYPSLSFFSLRTSPNPPTLLPTAGDVADDALAFFPLYLHTWASSCRVACRGANILSFPHTPCPCPCALTLQRLTVDTDATADADADNDADNDTNDDNAVQSATKRRRAPRPGRPPGDYPASFFFRVGSLTPRRL
ncbi:hypothetical protein C8F04DRAFT_1104138 [Mycena alexandri]|uniref:Uncharacterized protein n=1 Tax=Mycena alexandri TaxID=1745969 RepID=A0AAD6SUP0_9AGAR|nr:hypothetical protein C8F04DRAFT_1104138 [Mycena alexandri]